MTDPRAKIIQSNQPSNRAIQALLQQQQLHREPERRSKSRSSVPQVDGQPSGSGSGGYQESTDGRASQKNTSTHLQQANNTKSRTSIHGEPASKKSSTNNVSTSQYVDHRELRRSISKPGFEEKETEKGTRASKEFRPSEKPVSRDTSTNMNERRTTSSMLDTTEGSRQPATSPNYQQAYGHLKYQQQQQQKYSQEGYHARFLESTIFREKSQNRQEPQFQDSRSAKPLGGHTSKSPAYEHAKYTQHYGQYQVQRRETLDSSIDDSYLKHGGAKKKLTSTTDYSDFGGGVNENLFHHRGLVAVGQGTRNKSINRSQTFK